MKARLSIPSCSAAGLRRADLGRAAALDETGTGPAGRAMLLNGPRIDLNCSDGPTSAFRTFERHGEEENSRIATHNQRPKLEMYMAATRRVKRPAKAAHTSRKKYCSNNKDRNYRRRPRRHPTLCPHGKQKSRCKECGGSSI